MIPVKKGGMNIQLCSQERSLLDDLLFKEIDRIELILEKEKNAILKRDLTYYRKIYSKLTKKRLCSNCGAWIK